MEIRVTNEDVAVLVNSVNLDLLRHLSKDERCTTAKENADFVAWSRVRRF